MPHLHSGLTKARRYDGKYRAAKGSALKGTRGLYSARWLSRPNWLFVTRITPSALLARSVFQTFTLSRVRARLRRVYAAKRWHQLHSNR